MCWLAAAWGIGWDFPAFGFIRRPMVRGYRVKGLKDFIVCVT